MGLHKGRLRNSLMDSYNRFRHLPNGNRAGGGFSFLFGCQAWRR